jgi:hypothetical protein
MVSKGFVICPKCGRLNLGSYPPCPCKNKENNGDNQRCYQGHSRTKRDVAEQTSAWKVQSV